MYKLQPRKLLTILLFTVFTTTATAQIACIIEGTVVNRPQSTKVRLYPYLADPRFDGVDVEIKDGKFTCTIDLKENVIYEIAFVEELEKGAWMPYKFLTTDGTVKLTLNDEENFDKNSVEGVEPDLLSKFQRETWKQLSEKHGLMREFPTDSSLTTQAKALYEQIKKGRDSGVNTDSLRTIFDKMISSKEAFTPQYLRRQRLGDSLYQEVEKLSDELEAKKPTLYSYSNLVYKLSRYSNSTKTNNDKPLEFFENKFHNLYEKNYPDHSYTDKCRQYIASLKQMKVGGRFIDFTAPDLDGKMHMLSEQIQGKYAIIDLWASWCGPCRRSSMSFIELWDEFAGEQFTIVGVAGEFNNDQAMRKAIQSDGYKWLNLLELDRKGGIWEQYGAANSGGRVVMVDPKGTILLIDPTAEQIRMILQQAKIKK